MLADAVRRLQEEVALLELDRPVVDLDLRAHAERAAEIDLLRRQHDAMVVGELLHRVAGDAIDPRIADMEDVRRPPLQHHDVQGADIAAVGVFDVRAARLRMQPRIRGVDDALRRGFDRPGVRRAVIVRQEAFYRRFARHPADAAAADPVGQRHRDTLRAERRLRRHHGAVEVLVGLLAALVGVLADRDLQVTRHPFSRRRPSGARAGAWGPCAGAWRRG